MYGLLPDSCGKIKKVLVHQTYLYRNGVQIGNEIVSDFLMKNNNLGNKIELSVLSTFTNDEEKQFLSKKYEEWLPLVEKGVRVELLVSPDSARSLPYAQDLGVVNESPSPSVILSKSSRITNVSHLIESSIDLLSESGLEIVENNTKYNLEGGYIYASEELCLYSNKMDKRVIKEFNQKAIFVENIVGDLVSGLMEIQNPGGLSHSIPTHVDLMFSLFETDEILEVFYIDFADLLMLEPSFWGDRKEYLLNKRLDEYLGNIIKVIDKFRASSTKAVRVHKMPGIIGMEHIYYQGRSAMALYLYSGANLLFNSITGQNYAFYLHYPTDFDDIGTINNTIENELLNANIKAIPISRKDENNNIFEIQNSAGLRCIIKVLEKERT